MNTLEIHYVRKWQKLQLNWMICLIMIEKIWLERVNLPKYKLYQLNRKRYHTYHLDLLWNWPSEIWLTGLKKDVQTVSDKKLWILQKPFAALNLNSSLPKFIIDELIASSIAVAHCMFYTWLIFSFTHIDSMYI